MTVKNKVAYAYLDWAGDAGLRKVAGASKELVMSVVLTRNADEIKSLTQALRCQLNLPRQHEFHFVKCQKRIRQKYFSTIASWPFEAAVLVVRKQHLQDWPHFRSGTKFLAEVAARLTRHFSPGKISGACLIIDAPSRRYPEVVQIGAAIRKTLRAAGVKEGIDLKGRPAHTEAGLQLADMLAGAAMRFENKGAAHLAPLKAKVRVFKE